jgi:hypothetical protein
MLDGVVEYAPGLWTCASDYGFAMLHPPVLEGIDDLLLVMVYRPIGRGA